jgi:Protein of unknown function (DUF3592)
MTWWAWLIVAFVLVDVAFLAVGIPAIKRRSTRRALEAPPAEIQPGAIRGPNKGSYQGGTGSLPKVAGISTITLTPSSLRFDKLIGKAVDIPISTVRNVRMAKVWKGRWGGGNDYVIVETTEGDAGFSVKDVNGWASAIADATHAPAPQQASAAENSRAASALWKWLTIVFGSIGVLLGVAAGISAVVASQSISGDTRAEGIVVGNEKGGRAYHPVVEFATPGGAVVRFTGGIGTSPAYEIGSHVGVLYDPENPQGAVIDDFWQRWFWPTLLGILGAPFLGIGIAFAVVALIRRRRSRSVTTDP